MKLRSLSVLASGLLTLGFAVGAAAVPITMTPGSVVIPTVFGQGNDFTLTFDGGDTFDNILDFTVQGGGGIGPGGFIPSAAVAAIVFDGTDIIDSGDTIGGPLNPNNIVRGLTIPDTGIAAALLLDNFDPSAESFFLQLDGTPTWATLFSLDIDDPDAIGSFQDILDNAISSQRLRFTTPDDVVIPEPSAALVFGVGLLITRGALRRLR